MSERLSLQRLLKINFVHSRPLLEKKRVCSMDRFWSIEATEATALTIFCSSCSSVDKNRFREKFWDIKCDFAVLLSFLYLAGFLECWKIKLKAVLTWVTISHWKRIWRELWLWAQPFWKFKSGLSNRAWENLFALLLFASNATVSTGYATIIYLFKHQRQRAEVT